MPTAKQYRLQARECLDLARDANNIFVRDSLMKMARELDRAAHQTERRERDVSLYSHWGNRAA
jgi:hypothetical protein